MTDDIYADIKSPVIRRMLKNYKLSEAAESDNRKRALYAMNFRQGGTNQWDDKMLSLRKEGNRPSESYNQIPQFIHQVTNEMRMNMPQTRFVAGNEGSQDVAEVLEDLVRDIQSSSEGEVAYDNAADSQVTIGWGYWRYVTEYENDKSFDQIIKIKWVPNPLMVYDDPSVMEQDYSDRKFLIQVFDLPKDDFNDQHDRDYDSDMLESLGTSAPAWATQETVRVAEYWEVTDGETNKLYRLKAKDGKEAGEPVTSLPKGAKKEDYESRDVITPKVTWYKCTATEVLEQREWLGIYIPYVRVSGELQIIDGKTYYSGLVEGMIAPQKQYNYWSNTATEIMGLVPLAPFIAAAGQITPFKEVWDAANVRKYPYLPYEPIDVNGNVLPPPQRSSASADISGALALVNQAQQNFYTTTGIYPAALGKQGNETSGKAINARKVEGENSTFVYPDNMARGLRFGGRILYDLIKKVYDGARSIQGLKEDKSTRDIKINQKHTDENGESKDFDLTIGSYNVMVTTGPSFTTKRQEAADAMLQLATSTNLMEVAPDIFYKNQDFPGSEELAERYKKTLPAQLTQDDKSNPIPPAAQAQMMQMQQAIQQIGAQLQQAEQALADKQADIQNKQADLQLKSQQMQLNAQDSQLQAQLEMEKIQLEREKLQVETLKLELTGAAGQVESLKPQENEPDDENVLSARILTLRQKREQDAINAQAMQDSQAQEQQLKVAQLQQQMESDTLQQQRADMTLQVLTGLGQRLDVLTAAIEQPKVVIRDENGLIQGIQ